MSNPLLSDACRMYNEFADRLREQGELTPRWDADVCDLSGTEVMAWMELARKHNGILRKMHHRIMVLDRKLYDLEKQYHVRVSQTLRTMDEWGKRISAQL